MASASFLMTAGSALLLVVQLRRGAAGMLAGKLMGAAGSLLAAVVVSRKWWAGGRLRVEVCARIVYDVARGGREGQRMLGRLFSGLSLLLVTIAVFGSLIAQDVVSQFLDHRYSSAGRLIPWIIAGYLFHALYGILQPSLLQARRVGFL
jgi:hypothetical protein